MKTKVGSHNQLSRRLVAGKTTPWAKTTLDIRNRFYVSHPGITDPENQGETARWAKRTLADAIKHAETILDENPTRDHVAIVKIIRVVRRQKMPVIVDVVK